MPVSHYLSLCHYGDVWHPVAVCAGDEVVGFVMWAVDPDDQSGWLGGLTIDVQRQGRGLGRATVAAMIDRLRDEHGCVSAALGLALENVGAKRLCTSLGFVETGEMDDGEPIMRRPL